MSIEMVSCIIHCKASLLYKFVELSYMNTLSPISSLYVHDYFSVNGMGQVKRLLTSSKVTFLLSLQENLMYQMMILSLLSFLMSHYMFKVDSISM